MVMGEHAANPEEVGLKDRKVRRNFSEGGFKPFCGISIFFADKN